MRTRERILVFPADAPCFEGHFPGNPVVPAVAILAELIAWTETELGCRVTGVASARFRKPLLPGVGWDFLLEERETGEVVVTGRDRERVVVNVRLNVGQV